MPYHFLELARAEHSSTTPQEDVGNQLNMREYGVNSIDHAQMWKDEGDARRGRGGASGTVEWVDQTSVSSS